MNSLLVLTAQSRCMFLCSVAGVLLTGLVVWKDMMNHLQLGKWFRFLVVIKLYANFLNGRLSGCPRTLQDIAF